MRILNRPARAEEVKMALESLKTIADDNGRLSVMREKREEEWKVLEPKLQKDRLDAIARQTVGRRVALQRELLAVGESDRDRQSAGESGRLQRGEAPPEHYSLRGR